MTRILNFGIFLIYNYMINRNKRLHVGHILGISVLFKSDHVVNFELPPANKYQFASNFTGNVKVPLTFRNKSRKFSYQWKDECPRIMFKISFGSKRLTFTIKRSILQIISCNNFPLYLHL